MTKGTDRKGSDKSKLHGALAKKGQKVKDRGGKNLGIGQEHSRIPKGDRTQQSNPQRGRKR